MKTKVAFLIVLAMAAGSCVFAQTTEEYDDMYFTSKDRATLTANRQVVLSEGARRVTDSETASVINPTDSYSARNVNPEYISGTNSNTIASSPIQYFSPSYQPLTVNQKLSTNCGACGNNSYSNFNNFNQFSNPYGFNNYGMMNSFGGFGSFNSFGNSFYQPGLNFSFGNGWGSPSSMFWSYYGGNSFYGNGFGNPYGNTFYNPYGYGYSWYNSGYGSHTFVAADRPSRTSARNQEIDRYYTADRTISGGNTGGRSATQEYYYRGWRNDVQTANQSSWNTRPNQNSNAWSSGWNNSNTNNSNTNNGWNSNQNSSWGNSGGRSFSTGGGSSGGGSAGGGGGGSRRGRD
jgi:uncharacterized membrane protein YgcG